MFGLLASSFRLAFALVVGTLRTLSWCLAVAREMTRFAAVEAKVIVALSVALWVGYRLGSWALPFALVTIAPGAGRVLALASLLRWRVLLMCRHVVFDRFR